MLNLTVSFILFKIKKLFVRTDLKCFLVSRLDLKSIDNFLIGSVLNKYMNIYNVSFISLDILFVMK